MELRDLEYFVAVAEERSFTRGAQRSGIVHSAASAAVHQQERELSGEFDLSMVPQPDASPPGITTSPVPQMRLVLVCSRPNMLVHARDVQYRDIATRDFIAFSLEWGNRALVDGLFQADGVARPVTFDVVDVDTALALIRGGLGIGFLP